MYENTKFKHIYHFEGEIGCILILLRSLIIERLHSDEWIFLIVILIARLSVETGTKAFYSKRGRS